MQCSHPVDGVSVWPEYSIPLSSWQRSRLHFFSLTRAVAVIDRKTAGEIVVTALTGTLSPSQPLDLSCFREGEQIRPPLSERRFASAGKHW